MEKKIIKDTNGYNIYDFNYGDKEFYICFAGVLDLFFYLPRKTYDMVTRFEIHKEDGIIYNEFNTLYYNIINNSIKEKNYVHKKLTDGKKITWVSDDDCLDEDYNSLEIIKENGNFILTFKMYNKDIFNNQSIRIRTSGSRYGRLNELFMNMYTNLNKYTLEEINQTYEYHQITIDEYMSKKVKKLGRKKER